ncbi:MAG: type IV toxin-antitoxin system AbiEi family antitoxin [Pseudomonadota bacterium]|nr:type IV toxin-antitoxin system AbiEi family antitoxin [Pseudomonadota bacterium]
MTGGPLRCRVALGHRRRAGSDSDRVRVVFVQGRAGLSPTQTMNTPTGTIAVSTPEATALDLVRPSAVCGGLQSVATVLRELAERIDGQRLVTASQGVERTVALRLGWLLDHEGAGEAAAPLASSLAASTLFPVALRTDLPSGGTAPDSRWGVRLSRTSSSPAGAQRAGDVEVFNRGAAEPSDAGEGGGEHA